MVAIAEITNTNIASEMLGRFIQRRFLPVMQNFVLGSSEPATQVEGAHVFKMLEREDWAHNGPSLSIDEH